MKRLWTCLALACFPAAALASGFDLTWNDCVGTGHESAMRDFVCTGSVDETYSLFCQFKVEQDLPSFYAITAVIRLRSLVAGPLAPFWHYEMGGCQRPGGAGPRGIAIFDAIPQSCADAGVADPWNGDGSGGFEVIASYVPDSPAPGLAVLVAQVGRTYDAFPVSAGVNYYAFHLAFNNRNRTTCEGCAQRGGMYLSVAYLESNDGTPPVVLGSPDKYGDCVGFNHTGPWEICPTPVRNRTWGALKALYR